MPQDARQEPVASSGGRSPGFAAQFDHTSLWDLVQFECLRRGQRILRITSRGQVGFLYFRAGQIVHATTLRAVGELAVRDMLAWRAGSVEPWAASWPERETITSSWQSLLLGVAETAGTGGLPISGTSAPGSKVPPPLPAAAMATAPAPLEAAVETVVLARNGRVLRGAAGTGLPESAAYAAQMADLIGEFLGLEGFRCLEASFDTTHYLISRTGDGGLLAQRGTDPTRFERPPALESQP
jgi:hypothetical protein